MERRSQLPCTHQHENGNGGRLISPNPQVALRVIPNILKYSRETIFGVIRYGHYHDDDALRLKTWLES
ncbi:hypothetical protein HL670_02389 [Serratia plymuthica]|nr:hypothetical protein HL670_02389 [Serratia plymuthica]